MKLSLKITDFWVKTDYSVFFVKIFKSLKNLFYHVIDSKKNWCHNELKYSDEVVFMDLNEKNVEVETKSEEIVEHFIKTKSSLFKKIKNMVSKLSEKEYLKLKMEVLKNGNKASLPMLFDAVVNCKNPKIILDYAKTFGDSEAKLSYAISNTKNAEYIYKYALEVKDANISVLSVGMKDSQNYPYIFRFAKNIDNADIEVLSTYSVLPKITKHEIDNAIIASVSIKQTKLQIITVLKFPVMLLSFI